ncbi:hypothetical protein ACOME3_003519 [Neoechinorhynchus agilis]
MYMASQSRQGIAYTPRTPFRIGLRLKMPANVGPLFVKITASGSLLERCTCKAGFSFEDGFYEQVEGISMGSPLDQCWLIFTCANENLIFGRGYPLSNTGGGMLMTSA